MKLTAVLNGFLNRVWGRDPRAVDAFWISSPATSLNWSVADDTLTVTPTGQSPLIVPLSSYSLSSLIIYLSLQTGLVVSGLDGSLGSLSACTILDGEGEDGDALQVFTSLRWAVLDCFARELTDAEAAAAAAPLQLAMPTASGSWLDQLGSYLGNTFRGTGETDPHYAMRVPATVLRPKCNNIAMKAAIEALTDLVNVQVVDVPLHGPIDPIFDGEHDFDGSRTYDAEPTLQYGMFDVSAQVANTAESISELLFYVGAIVESMRASGTHVRKINLGQSLLADGPDTPLIWDAGGVAAPD